MQLSGWLVLLALLVVWLGYIIFTANKKCPRCRSKGVTSRSDADGDWSHWECLQCGKLF